MEHLRWLIFIIVSMAVAATVLFFVTTRQQCVADTAPAVETNAAAATGTVTQETIITTLNTEKKAE